MMKYPFSGLKFLANVKCCAATSVYEEEGKTPADSVTYVYCVDFNELI